MIRISRATRCRFTRYPCVCSHAVIFRVTVEQRSCALPINLDGLIYRNDRKYFWSELDFRERIKEIGLPTPP
jgi:hypothetical protein